MKHRTPESPGRAVNESSTEPVIGWALVVLQAVLLITLVLLPSNDHWSTDGWVGVVGSALFFGGLVAMAVGALGLGTALTATPVPKHSSTLRVDGFYRFVRHPIYTGVLALVAGIAVRSGSYVTLGVAAGTVLFFNAKARWEEQRLIDKFGDEYRSYMAVTPRFLPRPTRR